jgi:hypothetical protein
MTSTVDYSYSYVGAGTIAGAGYVGAERYLGTDGRCLSGWERDELLGAGLGIGLIWELTADRCLDGYWAGWNDAVAANGYADGLGAPLVSIWYACDFHAQPDQIHGPIFDYYRGVADVGGRRPRVYGGAPVIEHMCAHLGYGPGWQAAAASWSDYRLSPNACLLQEVVQIWGGAADTNVVLCPDNEIDWLWGRSGGDWFDMATEEDLRRIVNECLNSKLAEFYTGPRLLRVPPDTRVFELVMVDGERHKRHIETQDEGDALQWVDAIAGGTGDAPRDVTDPDFVAVLKGLPWLA